MNLQKTKNSRLFFFGATALAAATTLVAFLNRSGRSTDMTDLGVGVLYGVGIGLLILVAWRSGRHDPDGGDSQQTR